MYKIYARAYGSSNYRVIGDNSDRRYPFSSGAINKELNSPDELEFTIPADSYSYAEISCMTDEVTVWRTSDGAGTPSSELVFCGRATSFDVDSHNNRTYICEGALAYLSDTIFLPYNYSAHGASAPNTIFGILINGNLKTTSSATGAKEYQGHNASVLWYRYGKTGVSNYVFDKKFNVKAFNCSDTSFVRWSENVATNLEKLRDWYTESSLGGYVLVEPRKDLEYDGTLGAYARVIDITYTDSITDSNSQRIEFGSNLLEIAQNVEYADIYTALMPLGADDEDTGTPLNISSVNTGGSWVLYNSSMVNKYGFRLKVHQWEDVNTASALLTKGRAMLNAMHFDAIRSFDVSCIDLANAYGSDAQYLEIGKRTVIKSDVHGISQTVLLTGISLDLTNPANDSYTFGLTESYVKNINDRTRKQNEKIASLTRVLSSK